jgi:AcrR family transcriptional regulator
VRCGGPLLTQGEQEVDRARLFRLRPRREVDGTLDRTDDRVSRVIGDDARRLEEHLGVEPSLLQQIGGVGRLGGDRGEEMPGRRPLSPSFGQIVSQAPEESDLGLARGSGHGRVAKRSHEVRTWANKGGSRPLADRRIGPILTRQSLLGLLFVSRTPDPTAKIHLLRAAEEVFAARGLALAKVEEITRRAGTSKGAFYLHFASKEEAFKQVVESFLARLASRLPVLTDTAPDGFTPAQALAFWRDSDVELYEFLWQNRAIVSILQGCQADHAYLVEAFLGDIHARTVVWIAHWKEVSYFRPEIDTELAATLLVGAHNELGRKMLTSKAKPPIADWVRKTQAVFVRGFGGEALVGALRAAEGEQENPSVSSGIETTRARPAGARPRTRATG